MERYIIVKAVTLKRGTAYLTIQQLIYFREVASTLHFTKASQKLYVTTSALSYAISALEKELGVSLFVRETGKQVRLTRYGEALRPLVDRAIDSFDDIEREIRMLRDPMSGVVNVVYSYINGNRFVPRMFSAFNAQNEHSDISLSFEVNHARFHFEPDVVEGRFDIAFSCTPSTEGLEVVPFAKQELFCMVPNSHPLAERASVTVADLVNEPVVAYDQGRNLDKRVLDMFAANGAVPNIIEYTDEWASLFALVALGRGIAIFPLMPFDATLVTPIPIDDPMHVRDVYMMWPKRRKTPAYVEYVKNFCLNYYEAPPLV